MAVLHSSVPASGTLARVHQGAGEGDKLSLVATNLNGKTGAQLDVFLATQAEYQLDAFPTDHPRGEFRRTPELRFTGIAAAAPRVRPTYRAKAFTIRNAGFGYAVNDLLSLDIGSLRYAVTVLEVTAHGRVVRISTADRAGSVPVAQIPAELNHYPTGGLGRDLVLNVTHEIAGIEILDRGQGVRTATFELNDHGRRLTLEASTRIEIKPSHRFVLLKLDPDAMMSLNDVRADEGEVILVRSNGEVAVRIIR